MPFVIDTSEHDGVAVETARVETGQDLLDLRESEWHEGALRVLTYPSRVVGYLGYEPPLAFGGKRVEPPCTIVKFPSGDFEVT